MTARLTRLAKRMLPAPVRRMFRAMFGWRWFDGPYATWSDAQSVCSGYNDPAIVQRVLDSTVAVQAGRAAYERDGVLFSDPLPEPGLIESLGHIAKTAADRPIRVLDFGGALGTTYWRHRNTLAPLAEWAWDVVEQPSFVSIGRAHLANSPLRFFESVAEAEVDAPHDIILASGVLQYLESPHAVLTDWAGRGFRWILLNNLPLHGAASDRLMIQQVPPEIYRASYPVWFFNRERFLADMSESYEIKREFASEAVWPVGWRTYPSTGLLLQRRKHL
jgi:putative methyltransferase (TIGR04325 family)